MKKLNLLILTFTLTIFSFISPIYAAGSATVGFSGNSTVAVGSTIEIKMYVSNVSNANGGVVSLESNLSFDSSYLEYVSGQGTKDPYTFQINPSADYKIAGLDTTLEEGINGSEQTTVFTFTFKALKEGTTNVALTNVKLNDTDGRITATTVPKTITIGSGGGGQTPTMSSDATLKSLSVSGYTLSPIFSPDTTSYTVKVPSSTTNVKLDGAVNHDKAVVSGLGNITLTSSTTKVPITVTAEDGTKKTYNITIEKEQDIVEDKKSSDATLKSLNVSGYTLTPTFKSSINTYSMQVKNNVTALNVSAIPNSDKATVVVTGNKNWKEGVNVINIKVTAEDGTVNTYIVNVTRKPLNDSNQNTNKKSDDNYLKTLIINSSHEISSKFDKNVLSYHVTVPYNVDKLDLSYATSNSKAKVTVKGNENFQVDKTNTVEVEVTAEDGTKRIYILNVTRSTQTSDTDLKDIVIDGIPLSPAFNPDILEYDTKVSGDTDKLDIKVDPKTNGSKVEIIGNDNLKEGKNTVLIKVTDKNGFSKYYTINVEKEKKEKRILGLTPLQFGLISGIVGLLLLLLLLLLILLYKKKEQKKEYNNKNVTPIIEVKPEFNFGSKNKSDDDIVHGNLNQNSSLVDNDYENPKHQEIESNYEEKIPYDPYDNVVTKEEIIDAIYERDSSKLKMLLDQEKLNKQKDELRKKEEDLQRNGRNDMDDDWR